MFKAVYGKLIELSNSKKDSEEFKKEMLQLMNTMTRKNGNSKNSFFNFAKSL